MVCLLPKANPWGVREIKKSVQMGIDFFGQIALLMALGFAVVGATALGAWLL